MAYGLEKLGPILSRINPLKWFGRGAAKTAEAAAPAATRGTEDALGASLREAAEKRAAGGNSGATSAAGQGTTLGGTAGIVVGVFNVAKDLWGKAGKIGRIGIGLVASGLIGEHFFGGFDKIYGLASGERRSQARQANEQARTSFLSLLALPENYLNGHQMSLEEAQDFLQNRNGRSLENQTGGFVSEDGTPLGQVGTTNLLNQIKSTYDITVSRQNARAVTLNIQEILNNPRNFRDGRPMTIIQAIEALNNNAIRLGGTDSNKDNYNKTGRFMDTDGSVLGGPAFEKFQTLLQGARTAEIQNEQGRSAPVEAFGKQMEVAFKGLAGVWEVVKGVFSGAMIAAAVGFAAHFAAKTEWGKGQPWIMKLAGIADTAAEKITPMVSGALDTASNALGGTGTQPPRQQQPPRPREHADAAPVGKDKPVQVTSVETPRVRAPLQAALAAPLPAGASSQPAAIVVGQARPFNNDNSGATPSMTG